MNHADHVNLLRGGIPSTGGVWADFGSGTGAFTLALAELVGPGGEIHSIDKDAGALREQERAMRARFPRNVVHYLAANYTRPLELLPLDGLVAANTLHFHRDKAPIVRLLKTYLREGGRMLIVEYNIEAGNFAVPHPLPFKAWEKLAAQCGFAHTELLMTRPSRFLKEIYSAASG
jgi:ubiquinone/menaquinone biosynthesis C-methylase UbiE